MVEVEVEVEVEEGGNGGGGMRVIQARHGCNDIFELEPAEEVYCHWALPYCSPVPATLRAGSKTAQDPLCSPPSSCDVPVLVFMPLGRSAGCVWLTQEAARSQQALAARLFRVVFDFISIASDVREKNGGWF